jgi:hypothetical protein
MDEKTERKELSPRDIVRIVRKEIIANRNETSALRAELAVMRTELSGMHKVMEEDKLFIQSIALSLKAIREVITDEELKNALLSIAKSQDMIANETVFGRAKFNKVMSALDKTNDDIASKLAELGLLSTPDENIDTEFADEPTPTEPNDDDRCMYFHIDKKNSANTARCCLKNGHRGDHLYKCASRDCPGYPWAHSISCPHPLNTCGFIAEELSKTKVDDPNKSR